MKTSSIARNGNGTAKIAANINLNPRETVRWLETRLFFGLNNDFVGLGEKIPADAPAADWEDFLDQEIVPRFPSGFTVLDAEGFKQHVDTGGTVRETTRVLLVVHPDVPEFDEKLEMLRRKWCERYSQDSVLRVTAPANVQF